MQNLQQWFNDFQTALMEMLSPLWERMQEPEAIDFRGNILKNGRWQYEVGFKDINGRGQMYPIKFCEVDFKHPAEVRAAFAAERIRFAWKMFAGWE